MTKDKRQHTTPAIEALCKKRGGISKIRFVEAFKVLGAEDWDILIGRVWKSVADRMTDKTLLSVKEEKCT